MKRARLLAIFAFCLIFVPKASSEVFTTSCGENLAATLDTSTGTLTISGTGEMYDYSRNSPWYAERTSIRTVIINKGVTTIGRSAFEDCSSLTSITLPEGLTSIGRQAFYNCSSLTSITLPKSVTSIGASPFFGCSSLPVENGICYADTYLVMAWDIGRTTYQIKEGTRFIGGAAFKHCRNLTSITLPESVTSIEASAFYSCSSLTSITLPEGLTSIEERAFEGCSGLSSITLPESVTSIEASAFEGCSGLSSITIPESVTSIEDSAFRDCSSLASVTLSENLTSIGHRAFDGCPLSKVVNLSNCDISVSMTCKVYRRNDLVNFTRSSFVYSNSAPSPEYTKGSAPFTASLLEAPTLEKNVGTYTANYKFHFSDEDLDFNATFSYTYTITPAPVTVNVTSTSREYGDANPKFEYTVDGVFGSDAIDVTLTAPDYRSKAGSYSFTASTTAKNYSIVNTTGTLTITKVPLTVTADSYAKTYGDANPKFTVRYQGFKNGESTWVLSSLPTISSEATVASPVGEYAITTTGGSAQNYEFTEYTPGTLTIEKAPLTITADNVNRLYFEDAPEFTFRSKGWKNNEDASVLTAQPTLQCAAEKATPAGVYDIIPSGAEAHNYEISYQNGSLTIGKRTLTVTAKDAERSYGEENPKFDYTFDGFVNDETAAVLTTMPEAVTTAEQWSDVGTYSIVMQGGEATNYAFEYVAGTLSVLKAQQQIEWEQALDTVAVGSQVLLTATATSGLEVTYKYDDSMVEVYSSFDGMVLDCFKEGTVTIRATQEGNQNYHPAERVVKTINIVSTGIAPVIQEGEDAIYDLQGRKVLEAVKGFYIQNGKKVYRKLLLSAKT